MRRLAACLLAALPACAYAQTAPDPPIEQVEVTARRLDAARDRLQPSLGASVHALDPVALAQVPQGADAPLSQVLLQVPGVAQDSFGQIHVRGDHNEVQYRLDGVQLPEGLAVFGSALQTRFARSLDLITGALPAQYGFLQAAVVDIDTRSGRDHPGGEISVYGGARDYLQTALNYGASSGRWDLYVTGDAEHDRVGIENPTSSFNAVHDLSNQVHGLGKLSYTADDTTRISLTAGMSNAQFQIPDNPNQTPDLGYTVGGTTNFDSAALAEHQRELTEFAILSLQQQFGAIDSNTSLISRYSSLYFTPDPVGDLLFTGIAQTAARSVWSSGIQNDSSWQIAQNHTLRAGIQVLVERNVAATSAEVFPLDGSGGQIGTAPVGIEDDGGRTGALYGLYLQDEWKLAPKLTFNFGARFDVVDEYAHANQLSPRANLVWQATPATTVHVGYARYFTPPPFELVTGNSVDLFAQTSAAAPNTQDTTVKPERDHYFDAGIDRKITPHWHVGLDGYFKIAQDLIDEGQFGAPIILTAFNYRRGQASGLEASTDYAAGPWSLYANVSYSRAIGKDINSAQFNFDPADLAYISRHWVHLDHDQRWSGSGGIAYTAWQGRDHPLLLSADLIVGSGLRADGTVPNGRALPGYCTFNLGATQTIHTPWLKATTLRFDIVNLLDRSYEIRDGSGIGVGAPQYGRRRTILAGISQKF